MKKASDETLMTALSNGDMRALGAIYLRYGDSVLRFLWHQTSDRATAEDVAQDVFLTAANTAARYRHEDKLRAWLLAIAARKARSHRRKASRRTHLFGMFWTRDPVVEQPSGERRDMVERALSALPEKQREILLLHAIEGLSGAEIAVALGIGHGAVRARLCRARTAVRRHLAEHDASPEAMADLS